jgi:CRP/FNR family transcriptional regulator
MRHAELFPFLDELSERGRAEFGALRATHAPPRKPLLRRGATASGAYLVVKGALRVYYLTDEGREATLYSVEPGGTCVLALSSTLLDEPYPAWVEAGASGGAFVHVASATFHRAMDTESSFRKFVLSSLSGRIFELMQKLEEVTTSTIVRRVARYLVNNVGDDGEVTVTQTRLATELGTAREVVFRALRTLAAQRLISAQRGRVRLLDVPGLARAASRRPK